MSEQAPRRSPAARLVADAVAAWADRGGAGGTVAPVVGSVGSAAEVAALAAIYFDADDPGERDVVFEQLAALRGEQAEGFLAAMMRDDEDEAMRGAARVELARRGHPEAWGRLLACLADPDDQAAGEAAELLGEIAPPAGLDADVYGQLAALWRAPGRGATVRRQAMRALQFVDRPRALADYEAFMAAITAPDGWAEDELDEALLALVRWQHRPALPAVRALAERLRSLPAEDDRRLQVEAGLALLEGV